MALEDFEKALAEEKGHKDYKSSRHKDGHERRHQHHEPHRRGEGSGRHRHKRRKRSPDEGAQNEDKPSRRSSYVNPRRSAGSSPDTPTLEPVSSPKQSSVLDEGLKRDPWMRGPIGLDIDFTQRGVKVPPEPTAPRSPKAEFDLKIHDKELNKNHLNDLASGKNVREETGRDAANEEVNYIFGDAGAAWRMTKLRGVYRRAQELGKEVEDVATEQYGDLKSFDDAREEQTELDRSHTYGEGYVWKKKPSGELHRERQLEAKKRRVRGNFNGPDMTPAQTLGPGKSESAPATALPTDQSALNRLKAKMMKAKMMGAPETSRLEEEYNASFAALADRKQPDAVVLGAMESSMLAGSRKGEVRSVDNKRGRERGLVEENEDMSIDDMLREERRSKGQGGGYGRRFAERIAKDAKFDDNLDYLDDNAAKLAKRVHKSDINLRNIAISDFQKINKILDTCPLCHHEDTDKPPLAPIVSLATRVYLTLPTEPELSDGGACIIPIQHRDNLLYCDDDEWEEIRNFMKSLTRMYHDQGREVIFYENAAAHRRGKHAALEVVPLPYNLGETAPAFFKESLLSADDEWTQHKKIIDTLAQAKSGLGKSAFRRTLAKEMPYFHVWFEMNGGLGHIIENANRWPKGDLFAREVIGGMLDKGPEVIKRQGKWSRGQDPRIEHFRKRWHKFDWTRVLHDDAPPVMHVGQSWLDRGVAKTVA